MLTVNRVTLYALLFKFEKENVEWPISRTYPNVVAFKKNWDAFLTTIADLMESYRNPLSSFFKAIEDVMTVLNLCHTTLLHMSMESFMKDGKSSMSWLISGEIKTTISNVELKSERSLKPIT